MDQVRESQFYFPLLLSLFLHAGTWGSLHLAHNFLNSMPTPFLEIDLTRPFQLTNDPAKSHHAAIIANTPAQVQKPVQPPHDWVLPGSQTKELEKPSAVDAPVSPSFAGNGIGTGTGEVDIVYLTRIPKITNKDEISRTLRATYPESERRNGHEGAVVLDIHINEKGGTTHIDVIRSDSDAFTEAALKVAGLIKFLPALAGTKAVPVKVRQTITFKLEDL